MLGYETERRLVTFLEAVKEGEMMIEYKRERLCAVRDFSPYSAFMRLDRDANEFISSFEILNFLRDNREYTITERECYNLVKFFDSDEDGRLSFNDFLQILLPCEDNYLRKEVQDRRTIRVGRFDHLPIDIEIDLTSLIVSEINLLRKLEVLKGDLELRYDYSVYAAFKTVDRYNEGFINLDNLKSFFRTHYHYYTERELLNIIRRIDTDGDAKISYVEFSDYMRCQLPSSRYVVAENDLKSRSMSEHKRFRPTVSYSNSTPLRKTAPVRAQSAMKSTKHVYFSNETTPVKKFDASASRFGNSGFKTAEKSNTSFSGSPYKSPVKQEIENETVYSLKEQITLERELENAKINIAKKQDFNHFDAFRIFDIHHVGYVTISELKEGLASIGVYATYDELDLFYKRYDKDQDGKLRFSEFCDSMTPVDPYYSSMLNRRGSNEVRHPTFPRDECFTYSTRLEFKELWRTHLRVEVCAERLRQGLQQKPMFNTYDAFKTCDVNDDGIVTQNEIKKLMESRGLYLTEREVSTLMDKFDKDRDGRISYGEFMDEILPKSPAKAF